MAAHNSHHLKLSRFPLAGSFQTAMEEAMTRLSYRANNAAPVDEGPQGFGASVHKIKEQVLPRLLERVDPEAAASLNKEELPKNSVRSFLKCWPNSS